MKNSAKNIYRRHEYIEALLQEADKNKLSVTELASLCGVSLMTIRRDLSTLENMGIVTRFHGFACLNHHYKFKDNSPMNSNIEKIKMSIGHMVANFIHSGDTIFINTSSTALYTLDHLSNKAVDIITNNLRIHEQIHKNSLNPSSTVLITGGELRLPKEALTGSLAEEAVGRVIGDVAVIGCSGFSLKNGITTSNANESKINRIMIEQTQGKVIVVADYRKINNDSSFFVANADCVDILITDEFSDCEAINEMKKAGMQVIQANVDFNISKKDTHSSLVLDIH